MNIERIHTAFHEVINIKSIYRKIKVSKNSVAQYRWKLKNGIHITIDKKLSVLQRAGYHLESFQYTDKDIAEAIRFTIKASQTTRGMGAEYVMEKWKSAKNNPNQLL